MKITRDPKCKFIPVNITLQSQDEIDLLYAVFNFVPLMNCIRSEVNRLPEQLHESLYPLSTAKTNYYFERLEQGLNSI